MATKSTAAAILTARIAALTTDEIRSGIAAIGGGDVDTDNRMVRAFLIEEIITREGAAAGDTLMDSLGL